MSICVGHCSNMRLNEVGRYNPRYATLQNKWRTVSRMAIERKKKLQDAYDMLQEVHHSYDVVSFGHQVVKPGTLIWKHFSYGQLRPACSQNPAELYMLDLTSCIQFGSVLASNLVPFFQRRPRSYCAKPAWIRSRWPGQVLAKCIWSGSKLVCKNRRAQFWRNATSPVPFFHRWPRSYCAKPAWI